MSPGKVGSGHVHSTRSSTTRWVQLRQRILELPSRNIQVRDKAESLLFHKVLIRKLQSGCCLSDLRGSTGHLLYSKESQLCYDPDGYAEQRAYQELTPLLGIMHQASGTGRKFSKLMTLGKTRFHNAPLINICLFLNANSRSLPNIHYRTEYLTSDNEWSITLKILRYCTGVVRGH